MHFTVLNTVCVVQEVNFETKLITRRNRYVKERNHLRLRSTPILILHLRDSNLMPFLYHNATDHRSVILHSSNARRWSGRCL